MTSLITLDTSTPRHLDTAPHSAAPAPIAEAIPGYELAPPAFVVAPTSTPPTDPQGTLLPWMTLATAPKLLAVPATREGV